MSDPQWPHGLQPSRLLHPWDFPGKSTGVGCHCLLRCISHCSTNIWWTIEYMNSRGRRVLWAWISGEVFLLKVALEKDLEEWGDFVGKGEVDTLKWLTTLENIFTVTWRARSFTWVTLCTAGNYNMMYSAIAFVSLRKMVEMNRLALQFVDWPYKVMFCLWDFPGCWWQQYVSKACYLELLHPSWGRMVGASGRKMAK